jgi:hypothetical protein
MVEEGDPCPWTSCFGIVRVMPLDDTGLLGRLECDSCATIYDDAEIEIELDVDTLVSLDIQSDSCEPESNVLRINPELHFPLNEVFEVPDEFNGHQRGTFYYRNGSGVLRGPFMNTEEAGFDLCRRQYSRGFPCS